MKGKKIFLIAYDFRPSKEVGMLRVSYWFDQLRAENYNVTLITAVPGDDEPGVIRLPVKRNKFLSKCGIDDSYTWGLQVKQHLLGNHLLSDEDTVLFTGGPFLQIKIVPFLRKKYPLLNIIIDYRDPFANNPRFNDSRFKKNIKHWLEKKYNQNANTTITVNHVCEQLLAYPSRYNIIIENGYDDQKFKNTEFYDKDEKMIIYAGKFYEETQPETFIKTFAQENIKFCYCGSSPISIKANNITHHGQQSYEHVTQLMKQAAIGVILTGGDSFQSTTKIFDYIGAKLKILIITNGQPCTGNIHCITQNNPNVEWAINETESIRKALHKLLSQNYKEWNHQQWSRYHGYCKLKNIL